MELSKRVTGLKASATVAVANRAAALARQGADILSFAAGEPDFDTPAPIQNAAIDAIRAGQTKYIPTAGDPETRAALARKLTEENRLPDVTPDHVVITAGAKHAVYLTMQALIDPPATPDDPKPEVLLPTPAWVSYAPIAELAGGRIVELPTSPAGGFKITPEQLAEAITSRSRVLILNSPSNPCGVTYTEAELRALAEVIDESSASAPGLVVVTDEMYEKIIYAGARHFSIGAIPEIAHSVVTINGLSKAYAMTGWRLGYVAASGDPGLKFIRGISKLQGQTTTCVQAFAMPAIRAALEQCADDVERMRSAFEKRAQRFTARLAQMPGMPCVKPTGAFYAFPEVSAHFGKITKGGRAIGSALDFADALLAEKLVAAVPGEDFGGVGLSHVRFSFACSETQIDRGMDRLAEFLDEMQ